MGHLQINPFCFSCFFEENVTHLVFDLFTVIFHLLLYLLLVWPSNFCNPSGLLESSIIISSAYIKHDTRVPFGSSNGAGLIPSSL